MTPISQNVSCLLKKKFNNKVLLSAGIGTQFSAFCVTATFIMHTRTQNVWS